MGPPKKNISVLYIVVVGLQHGPARVGRKVVQKIIYDTIYDTPHDVVVRAFKGANNGSFIPWIPPCPCPCPGLGLILSLILDLILDLLLLNLRKRYNKKSNSSHVSIQLRMISQGA